MKAHIENLMTLNAIQQINYFKAMKELPNAADFLNKKEFKTVLDKIKNLEKVANEQQALSPNDSKQAVPLTEFE